MLKTIGILGGMGPLATCDLMEKIIRRTDAAKDQEHIHIYVDCNTNIADRTAAILHGGADPLPEMVKSAVRLQSMGADALLLPCNTAHYFYGKLQPYVDIPILHMPRETASLLKKMGVERAAVLATDGTIQCGIYDKALEEKKIQPIHPEAEDQKMIMSLIYDYVKAGKPFPEPARLQEMAQRLLKQGAQALILGCTELPIAFAGMELPLPAVDPTDALACAAVRFAGAKLREN